MEQLRLHDGQLVRQSAVDDIIGRVDVGNDVAQLAGADVMPVFQRPLRIVGAKRGVTLHPTHQPQVCPAHVLSVELLHLHQRLDI